MKIIFNPQKQYIVSSAQLEKIYEILDSAEVYESKWNRGESDSESYTTHHVYTQEVSDEFNRLEVMPLPFYNVCKLAGQPNQD